MARKKIDFGVNPLLSGPSLVTRNASGSPYREIDISEIDVDPEQPRKSFDKSALESLSKSIAQYGVLSPILIRMTAPGGSYRVVAGERRLRASKLAGLNTIPAIVEIDDEEEGVTSAKQLVENLQRENLSSLERANAIGHMKDSYGWSVREIGNRIGISKTMVQRSLDVLGLGDDLKAALAAGASESKVLTLKGVEDPKIRRELLARIDHYTRGQLEAAIESLLGASKEGGASHGGTKSKHNKAKKKKSADDLRFVEEVQNQLGLKVEVVRKEGKSGQGKVVIDFYSKEDLAGLYDRLATK